MESFTIQWVYPFLTMITMEASFQCFARCDFKDSNQKLEKFLIHLEGLEAMGKLPCDLDLQKFRTDLDKGMHFDSSIPQGFGVGSSGAIVAAIYDNYSKDKIASDANMSNEKFIELKKIFGILESYYHGKSSGLDPLICYLNLPVLIKSKSEVGTVGLPDTSTGKERYS